MYRLVAIVLALLATVTVASAQLRPQQTPESATGTKTDQEQGESKAQRQGSTWSAGRVCRATTRRRRSN